MKMHENYQLNRKKFKAGRHFKLLNKRNAFRVDIKYKILVPFWAKVENLDDFKRKKLRIVMSTLLFCIPTFNNKIVNTNHNMVR